MTPALKPFSPEWAQAVRNELSAQQANWDYFLVAYEQDAKIKKARFDALVTEGFTEAQALYLIANTRLA